MIDAHAHIREVDYSQIKQHEMVFVASASEADWPHLLKMQSNRVKVGIGIHPWHVKSERLPTVRIADLRRHLLESPHAFLGETGLDKSPKWKQTFSMQMQYFEAHIRLANELSRPMVVHSVKAHHETIKALNRFDGRPYIHGFIGSVEVMRDYGKVYFGISHRTLKSTKTRIAIAEMSPSSLLIESDDTPNAKRLEETMVELSKIKSWTIEFTKSVCIHNACTWLGIRQ